MDFNDYEWHDATIKDIFIDRKSNTADTKNVVMSVMWPDGSFAKVIFSGVVEAIFNLNFGTILSDGDVIFRADIAEDGDLGLVEFYEKWCAFGLFGIKYFMFQTNSGSKIKVYADKFEVIMEAS